MNIDSILNQEFGNFKIGNCKDPNCKLNFDSFNDPFIIKGDKYRTDIKMCDCIMFIQKDGIILVCAELKSRTVHVSDVVKKLQNSIDSIRPFLSQNRETLSPRDIHFLVIAIGFNNPVIKSLERKKIRIGNRKLPILTRKCGYSLKTLLT